MLPELELRPEPRAPAYIGEVLVDGVAIELDDVLASVSIRHGRDDLEGPAQSSTATVRLHGLGRGELEVWEPGAELRVSSVVGVPLFTGRVNEASLTQADPDVDAILEVIATGRLASAGGRNVGGHAWPAEPWKARVERILGEAGYAPADVLVQAPTPDVPIAATKPDDPEAGTFASMSALDALELARQDVGAAIFDAPDGRIIVQAFDARKGLYPALELDPADVLFSPAWSKALDVANRVVLGYGYGAGSITVDEPVSQDRFGVHWTGYFTTGLADETAARARASLWVDRVAWPRWKLPTVTLLYPVELEVGQLVQLVGLPASAPFSSFGAVVEGWVDTIEGPDWTVDLLLSDPIFSGLGLAWDDVPLELSWAEVDPACDWNEAYLLDNLQP